MCFSLVNLKVLLPTLVLLLIFGAPSVLAAPLKLKHESFVVTSKSSGWCSSVVQLRIETLQPAKVFDPPNSAFLQMDLLGKVRAIASFTCPNIEKLVFIGWSNSSLYYAAVASKESGWRLKGLYAPP